MPARIEFDFNRAIDRATQLFWKNGYSRTPLRQLLKAMGIGEGSFYNTFGSKKRLYKKCLEHYNETVSRRRLNALSSARSVKIGIRAFFSTLLDEIDNPKTPSVCMLAGSLSRDVMAERELGHCILNDINAFASIFVQRMETARTQRELPSNFDVAIAAQVLITFLQGFFRVIRVLYDRKEMERQIEMLLRGLDL